jgi:hypothetical protein
MFKKFVSLFMLYAALAIMLGHDFIPHHHDFEHKDLAHHHHHGHAHHHGHSSDNNSEEESDDWGHFFSNFHHCAIGLTFLTSHPIADDFPDYIPLLTADVNFTFVFQPIVVEVRQNSPPYFADYHNSQEYLPNGLRAPPAFIV